MAGTQTTQRLLVLPFIGIDGGAVENGIDGGAVENGSALAVSVKTANHSTNANIWKAFILVKRNDLSSCTLFCAFCALPLPTTSSSSSTHHCALICKCQVVGRRDAR